MNIIKSNNLNTKYFPNEKQKQIAILVRDIVINSGLTQKEFADSIGISLATLTNIYRPNNQKLPTPKVLRLISLKTDNPIVTYKQFMTLLGYDILKYPFHKGVNNQAVTKSNSNYIIAFQVYKIWSHLNNQNYCTLMCAYNEQEAVTLLGQKGYIVDKVEHICSPGILEHKQIFEGKD